MSQPGVAEGEGRGLDRAAERFLEDVLRDLAERPKWLSSKYFYDQRGSELFDQICQLPEYYPTRTELAITEQYADAMARRIGPRAMLIEYGSGSSLKTRLLLDRLEELAAYVPVDISCAHLARSAKAIERRYEGIEVLSVCADFTRPFGLPAPRREFARKVVYFPGSTIGNFTHEAARSFLREVARVCGPSGGLLVGVDLRKDRDTLERAYNDAQGVTAEFNLNLLRRINAELGGDFQLERFRHLAVWDDKNGRIVMLLVSTCDQTARIGDHQVAFREGETIRTEYSHKYSLEQFRALAATAGLEVCEVWTDPKNLFSVQYLTVRETEKTVS